jgi:hypothetical protein
MNDTFLVGYKEIKNSAAAATGSLRARPFQLPKENRVPSILVKAGHPEKQKTRNRQPGPISAPCPGSRRG